MEKQNDQKNNNNKISKERGNIIIILILSSKSCTHGCIYCDSRSKCYYDQMLDAYNIRLKDRLNIY